MKKVVTLLLLLLFASLPPASAQNNTGKREVDSTLLSYYRRCNKHIRDSTSILTADTLFRLAGEKNDTRMQAVAMCIKTDHYYTTNQFDSLKTWIQRTQAFTRKHNELTHYYFAWKRLIRYYTNHAQYTLAQYELERYLAQAEKDGYKPGMADAYQQLAHIYRSQSLGEQAADYYRKAIEYIEENDLDKFQIWALYSNLASIYLGEGKYAEASEAIAKGMQNLSLPENGWPLKLQKFQFYVRTDSLQEARALYREIERGHDGRLKPDQLFAAKLELVLKSANYREALELTDKLLDIYEAKGEPATSYNNLYAKRAYIYTLLGDYKSAYENQRYFSNLYISKVSEDNERTLGEFATLLDVNRLDRENAELQQRAQEERLRHNRMVIISLTAILLLAAAFIAVQLHMNRRLAHAKRAAEDANRMKGIFIRNITHEINTPLNAIIGFSELAATAPDDDPERSSYIEIVQENSGHLQKLVDDVLYISDLESTETLPACTDTDLDVCCRECIDRIETLYTGKGPDFRFRPGPGKLTIRTSRMLVRKVIGELLLNASRFAPDGPITLTCDVAQEVRSAVFTVTDTGHGIPAAEAERIFDRFVKLDPFTQGMGLGLSVCRLIADALGGNIRLDTSYEGKGARFVFTVPVG